MFPYKTKVSNGGSVPSIAIRCKELKSKRPECYVNLRTNEPQHTHSVAEKN